YTTLFRSSSTGRLRHAPAPARRTRERLARAAVGSAGARRGEDALRPRDLDSACSPTRVLGRGRNVRSALARGFARSARPRVPTWSQRRHGGHAVVDETRERVRHDLALASARRMDERAHQTRKAARHRRCRHDPRSVPGRRPRAPRLNRGAPTGPHAHDVKGRTMGRTWVWAPRAKHVDLVLFPDGERIPMRAQPRGYYEVEHPRVRPGQAYAFALDGGEPRPD